jgi:hypothetical protein
MAWALRVLTFGYYGQAPEERPMVRFVFDDPEKERKWLNSLEKKGSF